MLDFLEKCGISKRTLNEIVEKYPDSLIYNLSCNELTCLSIIKYLLSIGINCIDVLLIEKIDLFMMPLDRIKYLFDNCDEDDIISLINNDVAAIELLFKTNN